MWGVGNSKIDKKDGTEGLFMENPFCSERNRNSLTPNPSPKARGYHPDGFLPLGGVRGGLGFFSLVI